MRHVLGEIVQVASYIVVQAHDQLILTLRQAVAYKTSQGEAYSFSV